MTKLMKKIMFICGLICLGVMLVACVTTPVLTGDAEPNTPAQSEPQNTPTGNTKLPEPEPIVGTLQASQNPDGVHLACIEWGANIISITKDGEQLISGEDNWYYKLEEKATEIAGNMQMNLYSLAGMYDDAHKERLNKATYGSLSEYCTADGEIDWIALGGDWQPFPCTVEYKRYTTEDQPQNKEWTAHFKKLLADSIPDTPVIITEAWFFDLDGDGKNETIVNASNAVKPEEGTKSNPPNKNQTGVYTLCTFFSESLGIVDLDNNLRHVEREFSGNSTHAAYTEPAGEGYYENSVTAIQYGENGELIRSPIFNTGEYGAPPRSFPIICDTDGDGTAELITFRQEVYGPLKVYNLQDGELVFCYTIAVSA